MTTGPRPPAPLPRATVGSMMLAIAVLAVALGLFRVAAVVGLLGIEAMGLGAATEAVARRTGQDRARAAVLVLTRYAWAVAAIGAMQAVVLLLLGTSDSPALFACALPLIVGFAATLIAPLAAAVNLILSIALVGPIYYRGGSDRDADAWPLMILPLISWAAALGAFAAAWGLAPRIGS